MNKTASALATLSVLIGLMVIILALFSSNPLSFAAVLISPVGFIVGLLGASYPEARKVAWCGIGLNLAVFAGFTLRSTVFYSP
ncbi:hypothetical protein Q5741_07875 [Paenibacillus sp. JX-17]|uniref:DUF389 domain-containing protein n=1 Tax=Paenibacillus lacisoli TaxID=3064525 RepID=A0ABT9CAP8_9BACL|nr:hypothetical protein [Paenibacillus sp. JX-17]MDO7906335.1 hypothetical protein [Paenibacillus sp. JX-17]